MTIRAHLGDCTVQAFEILTMTANLTYLRSHFVQRFATIFREHECQNFLRYEAHSTLEQTIGDATETARVGAEPHCGRVIQLLGSMRNQAVVKLVGKTIVAPRPMKSESGEDGRHRMIGVSGDAALRTKSKHDLRLEFPDLKC